MDKELSKKQKEEILDYFGRMVIENVRDRSLDISMKIASYTTINPLKLKQYESFAALSEEERETVCDLLSETISDTIFNFLHMFEDYSDNMKITITKDGKEHNLIDISEVLGGEIAFQDEDGWIQKFSKIGRPTF